MSTIETYYLIDFENVHEDGLSGPVDLGSHDHVHLFSTRNAPKISFETLANFNSADLSSHEIPAGNQSLDMHLVSFLGYLIGINRNQACKYVIVSKDTGYDKIISFWKNQNAATIVRQDKISSATSQNRQKNTAAKATASTKTNNTAAKATASTKTNNTAAKATASTKTNNAAAKATASTKANNTAAKSNSSQKNSTRTKATAKTNTATAESTKKHNATTQINNEVQKKLSKSGFDNAITSHIASVISKHYNDDGAKQTVYRAIIAKYGQKQGLNIYNHIKKCL